jgi:hypothetical protein
MNEDGDFGRYTVKVSNDAGTAESAAAITQAGQFIFINIFTFKFHTILGIKGYIVIAF